MARPTVGDKPLTAAERQRRSREARKALADAEARTQKQNPPPSSSHDGGGVTGGEEYPPAPPPGLSEQKRKRVKHVIHGGMGKHKAPAVSLPKFEQGRVRPEPGSMLKVEKPKGKK